MRVKHFLNAVENDRVHRAIQSAEEGTSGDIVVFIGHRRVKDPLAAAKGEFSKLRLDAAADGNSLLIFIVPESQKFAVVGGKALHEKMGQNWWHDLTALLTRHFRKNHYTEGLVETIEEAGRALKTYFPATTTDRQGQRDIVEE